VPLALLFAALGLALAFAPRRAWVSSLLVLVASLSAVTFLTVPQNWLEGVFAGCWISVIATAVTVLFFRRLSHAAALGLSFNAGFWASAVASVAASRLDLVMALAWLLILFPASRVVVRYGSIPIKVASSWIIAVAVLAATLQLLPVTPGYLPDHLE
jgi:hypothetical protein